MLLGLNETIDHLAKANSVCWYGHVLQREDGHVLRRALDFELEGQRKKEAKKNTKEAGSKRKHECWFEQGRCTLLMKVDCWCWSDYCWVEVNPDTLTSWGYYWI